MHGEHDPSNPTGVLCLDCRSSLEIQSELPEPFKALLPQDHQKVRRAPAQLQVHPLPTYLANP